jgi:hypothetical protein
MKKFKTTSLPCEAPSHNLIFFIKLEISFVNFSAFSPVVEKSLMIRWCS